MTDQEKFIAELYPAAVKISEETGMSKELILAQAAQETGWGQHVLAGTDNVFNIKASSDWNGPTKAFNVWEIENGKKVWKDQDFRVYGSMEEALRDRVKFLQENPRYTKAGLFDEGTKGDFANEAAALQKAGYATDPLYARHLIAVYNGPTMQHAIKQVQGRAQGGMLEQGDHGTAVGTLQSRLAKLGYTDTHGQPLKRDGEFGPNTRHAVEAFQRDHQLPIDGKVGPQTDESMDRESERSNRQPVPTLSDLHHPDHDLYAQALAGVHQAEVKRDIAPGAHSERLAAALVVAARSEGIRRIDAVLLSESGDRAFVEQKGVIANLTDKTAFVETRDAIQTTTARSSATLAQMQQQHDPTRVAVQTPLAPEPEPTVPGCTR